MKINKLCKTCLNTCKQTADKIVSLCGMYRKDKKEKEEKK